jgi:hypothetical protein
MKTAQTQDGKLLVADASAPRQAICPCCGGPLTLRSRQTMDKKTRTYFWRHRSNRNSDCSARNRPIG